MSNQEQPTGWPRYPRHLAILAFRARLRGEPAPHDLFNLPRIENDTLTKFFSRDTWLLEEAQTLPYLAAALNDQPPQNAILEPVLNVRTGQA